MQNALFVFFGGGLGAVARHFMSMAVHRHTEATNFPYHILSVNLLGAFLIGTVMEVLALRSSLPQGTQILLVTGFLGGFTTFSAFSLECAAMLQRGDYGACAVYIAASVIGTIILVFAGAALVRAAF